MSRIAYALTGLGHSRLAAEWIQQFEAAFANGSLLAGAFRFGLVALVALTRPVLARGANDHAGGR